MKKQVKQRVFSLLAAVFAICVLFFLKAAALDTPWVTMQPDAETTENVAGESPQTTSGTQAGDPVETADLSDALTADTETGNNANSAAQKAFKKRGCRSTVHEGVLLFPLLFSAGVLLKNKNRNKKGK